WEFGEDRIHLLGSEERADAIHPARLMQPGKDMRRQRAALLLAPFRRDPPSAGTTRGKVPVLLSARDLAHLPGDARLVPTRHGDTQHAAIRPLARGRVQRVPQLASLPLSQLVQDDAVRTQPIRAWRIGGENPETAASGRDE